MIKYEALRAIARKRTASIPQGYRGIGEYHSGAYECMHVSPFQRSAGNVDSPIVLVLQDWCSDDYLSGPRNEDLITLGYDPRLPTNVNLIKLLRAHLGLDLDDVYVTNLFPFIKPGGMTNAVPASLLAWAANTT
jgi:restriction system protein